MMSDQMRLPGTTKARRKGPVYRATNTTVRLLRDAGRIEDVDAAKVAIARTLADNIDQADADGASQHTLAMLAGRYVAVLEVIYGRDQDTGPALADLFAEVGYDAGEPPF